MKSLQPIVIIATLMCSLQAQAIVLTLGMGTGPLGSTGNPVTDTMCAPQVRQGNVSATEIALNELSMTELKDATKFKQILTSAKNLNEEKRMDIYFKMVGVTDNNDIIQFISARDIDSKYINALTSNVDLNEEQARLVINKISAALLGQIK
jgi:hypothetical protein